MATLNPAAEAPEVLPTNEMAALTVEGEAGGETELPPHRSHDPAKSLKRSDPFQFGQRYLTEQDDVFEFNAWDHVETDDAYKEYAEQQFEKQRQSPVSDFDKSKCTFFSFSHTSLS
jgi:tRNAThr (cytosine32-N3)-methyltransferase